MQNKMDFPTFLGQDLIQRRVQNTLVKAITRVQPTTYLSDRLLRLVIEDDLQVGHQSTITKGVTEGSEDGENGAW